MFSVFVQRMSFLVPNDGHVPPFPVHVSTEMPYFSERAIGSSISPISLPVKIFSYSSVKKLSGRQERKKLPPHHLQKERGDSFFA
jgi:hypothetical protein